MIKYFSLRSFVQKFQIIREIKSKEGKLHFRRRQIFAFKGWSLCFHEFFAADEDYFQHDHPSDFWMLVLAGGYSEWSKWNYNTFKPFSFRFVPAEFQHRICRLLNDEYSLTISLAAPKRREWGYHTSDGWMANQEYRKRKNEQH